MGRLFFAITILMATHPSAFADLRVKVRSTPYYDVELTLGNNQRQFTSGDAPKEQIVYLSTEKINETETFQICYMAKSQKNQPNAKNLGFVHMDFLAKGQVPQTIRSISPTGNEFSAGKRTCEKFSFKMINDAGVDVFEIAAMEDAPTPNPGAAKVFEPIEVPKEDEIAAAEARAEMMVILEKSGKECKDGDKVIDCSQAKAAMEAEVNKLKQAQSESTAPDQPEGPATSAPTTPEATLPSTAPVASAPVASAPATTAPPATTTVPTETASPARTPAQFKKPVSWSELLLSPGALVFYFITLISIFSMATILKAAGQPAWSLFIPFYNAICFARAAEKPGWMGLLLLVPLVNIPVNVMINIGLAQRFQKDLLYAIGMTILPFIFFPILAFQVRGTQSGAQLSRASDIDFNQPGAA